MWCFWCVLQTSFSSFFLYSNVILAFIYMTELCSFIELWTMVNVIYGISLFRAFITSMASIRITTTNNVNRLHFNSLFFSFILNRKLGSVVYIKYLWVSSWWKEKEFSTRISINLFNSYFCVHEKEEPSQCHKTNRKKRTAELFTIFLVNHFVYHLTKRHFSNKFDNKSQLHVV